MRGRVIVAGVAVMGLLWFAISGFREGALSPDPGNPHGSVRKANREGESYDEHLEEVTKKLREARKAREAKPVVYNLSGDEVGRFLAIRGKTPSTLLFALICSEDRSLLEDIKALPDAPLKFVVLQSYSTGAERLEYARKLSALDPTNKMSALILADALREAGAAEESAHALGDAVSRDGLVSYQSQLLEEFRQADQVFGEERGGQLLELHAAKYPSTLGKQVTGLYLDSLDSENLVKGGKGSVERLVADVESFYARIGFPGNIARQQAYVEVGNYARYWRGRSGNKELDGQLDELGKNSDAEFLLGLKNELRMEELDEAGREKYWRDLYFGEGR